MEKENPKLHSHTFRHNICSWLCVLYALFITSIGISLPLTLGWDFEISSNALDDYLAFYIVLYVLGIVYFIFYHTIAKTIPSMVSQFKAKMIYLRSKMRRKSIYTAGVSSLELVSQSRSTDTPDETVDSIHIPVVPLKITSGQFGLKIGVKASVAVFLIMICMELSAFVHTRMTGITCQVDAKGIYVIFQLIYVVLQTFYVLKAEQVHVERYWVINHFGISHLISTTICTGIFLTAYDCLGKVAPLPQVISERENFTLHEKLPPWLVEKIAKSRETTAVNDSEAPAPCSAKSYINDIHANVKPFTFTFTMFFVYCCSILLILLYMHLRKKLYQSKTPSMFFKLFNTKAATFSSGAGLSLIVVSVIISLLTLNANNNTYVSAFLIFLHTQASVVGLIALSRITRIPCRRKISPSKYTTIYLLFYFFVCLSGVFQIISELKSADEEGEGNVGLLVLEVMEEFVDLLQAFLHGLLILVGFTVVIAPGIVAEKKMPREILIHLAATNFSALISEIFNSKAVLFNTMSTMIKRSEANEISSTIAWAVLGSILKPCEEFNRFHTIIYLVKLYKLWTHES